jgi:hypothetical protein
MKALFSIFALFLLLPAVALCQPRIALEHNGLVSMHVSLDSAYANAQNGDAIYFPGGTFNIGSKIIAKRLRIYGAGHYPDSSQVGGATVLNGNLSYITGSDTSMLSGVYLTGSLVIGTGTQDIVVKALFISRSSLGDVQLSYHPTVPNPNASVLLSENVLRSVVQCANVPAVLEKNIINGRVYALTNGVLKNNLFLTREHQGSCYCYGVLETAISCYFEGNVFQANNYILGASSSGNNFVNNIFAGDPGASILGTNNLVNVPRDSMFVNQPDWVFGYNRDYHLKPGLQLQYPAYNFSVIGLYGAAVPYKEGAVPANPHIRLFDVAPVTTPDGKLNIHIKVGAQDR